MIVRRTTLRTLCFAFALVSAALVGGLTYTGSLQLEPAAQAQEGGEVPGGSLGSTSDSEIWRQLRRGIQGTVSIPNKQAGVLIQSEGEDWRAFRNGPLSTYGAWAMLGVVVLLALFFLARGRVRLEGERTGRIVERFGGFERFAHWLTAVSFIILALTGLNTLYGRYVLKPILSPEIFTTITQAGKFAHNFVAFAFMVGLILIFLLWVWHNIPTARDFEWLIKAGGLLSKGVHPPAKKFNAGQKIVFWLVVLCGLSLSLSGISLLFPFQLSLFSGTAAVINGVIGTDLPTNFTPMQEMQLNQVWHGTMALFLILVILGHIYIGTLGMEGAFDAMGTGKVDEEWAREHHSLWLEEIEAKQATLERPAAPHPAPGE
jgi:formate dehydrogenase subunit gamma